LHDRDSESKSKLEAWHFPRLVELRYPTRIAKTGDKLNWITSMMVDPRLSERDRLVLTRLALHLNSKSGRCDPAERLLALELSIGGKEESATRVVRRSLARAKGLGWIKRRLRHGGDTRHNQSNLYTLTIPPDILAMLRPPTGQMDAPDRTNTPSRPDSPVPLILKLKILNDKSSALARHPPGAIKEMKEVKEGVADKEGSYSEDALSLCEHFFHNCSNKPRSFSALRAFCRQNKGDITFGQLTALVNAGKVRQSRDGYWMEASEDP
jgi:hypothetical protein